MALAHDVGDKYATSIEYIETIKMQPLDKAPLLEEDRIKTMTKEIVFRNYH